MASIKQKQAQHSLPDFRNFGIMLRSLLGINLLALMAALIETPNIREWLQNYVNTADLVQPLLLLNVGTLALFSPLLRRLAPPLGHLLIIFFASASSAYLCKLWRTLGLADDDVLLPLRAGILGAASAGTLLFYFAVRTRAFSPALNEARLQALTARIRPHFLFNSLNAVLSLIRAEPKRAEIALEELADLFHALMRDHRDLLPLADELALCRQYLNLEKLRLGERLQIEWDADEAPLNMKIPPLMLQPLLENAVYHGIEPSAEVGIIRLRFVRKVDELHIHLSNPCNGFAAPGGNHMALENIRERLALFYDLEARLETQTIDLPGGGREYHLHIVLPCRI